MLFIAARPQSSHLKCTLISKCLSNKGKHENQITQTAKSKCTQYFCDFVIKREMFADLD